MSGTDIVKKTDDKVAAFVDKATDIWKERDEIRKIFAPTLSDQEFKFFVAMGISLSANPFLKEIFAIKFGKGDKAQPAQIIVARDLYRRKAQQLEHYKGHVGDAVYPGEEFALVRDDRDRIIGVNHKPDFEIRYGGADLLLPYGAYCVVYKDDTEIPFYVFAPFREYHMTNAKKEYANGQPTGERVKNDFWQNKPETMIKKVAEGQALRGAFQGTFQGTYTPDEIDLNPDLEVKPVAMPQKRVDKKNDVTAKNINAEQLTEIAKAMKSLGIKPADYQSHLKENYGIAAFNTASITVEQYDEIIGYPEKPEKEDDDAWISPDQFNDELELVRRAFNDNHDAMAKKGLADFNTLMKFFAVEAKPLSLSPAKMREIESFVNA